MLFRLLSRDDDPFLQFEFAKLSKDSPAAMEWAREHMREAACALVRQCLDAGTDVLLPRMLC